MQQIADSFKTFAGPEHARSMGAGVLVYFAHHRRTRTMPSGQCERLQDRFCDLNFIALDLATSWFKYKYK
jgi:hypothetical protein